MYQKILLFIFFCSLTFSEDKLSDTFNYKHAIDIGAFGIGWSSNDGMLYSLGLGYQRQIHTKFSLTGGLRFQNFSNYYNIYGPYFRANYHFSGYNSNSILVGLSTSYSFVHLKDESRSLVKENNFLGSIHFGYMWLWGKRDRLAFSTGINLQILSSVRPGMMVGFQYRF